MRFFVIVCVLKIKLYNYIYYIETTQWNTCQYLLNTLDIHLLFLHAKFNTFLKTNEHCIDI